MIQKNLHCFVKPNETRFHKIAGKEKLRILVEVNKSPEISYSLLN